MLMRFMSDLHLEFHGKDTPPFEIPELATDADTVLVLAGDIAKAARPGHYTDFINTQTKRFRDVIWIMGNHEHWDGSVHRSIPKILRALGMSRAMHECGNLWLVENEVVQIDHVDFICATLWTDMSNNNPLATMKAQMVMRDYKRIRMGDINRDGIVGNPYKRTIRPDDTVNWHHKSLNFIVDSIIAANEAGRKAVVVTHHAPSYASLHPQYVGDDMNCAYVSPLDQMILELKPAYWIHGHIHHTNDYNIGETNVLANPRGYVPDYLNHEFDPSWTIDLS